MTKYTHQQLAKVSINRESLLDLASNEDLDEIDYRVILLLLTQLNGFNRTYSTRESEDPLNYKKINKDSIADSLDINKKDVKKSIKKLLKMNLIEMGDNQSIKNGYRFTF